MPPHTDRTEHLLAQAGWIRRLAHSLVRDPERADDLVQETWVAALGHPQRSSGSVGSTRAFLARILRNALHQSVRSERHREARERDRESPTAGPTGPELVEEVESQRVLLEEVLALSEPARDVILQRYFRERSAAEIARAEGIPAATVRSRLARGLAELRERLDARHGGDRSAWSLGLLGWAREPLHAPLEPLTRPPSTLGPAVLLEGALVMSALKIVAVVGVAALAVFGVSQLERPRTDAAPPASLDPVTPPAPAASEPVRSLPEVTAIAPEEASRVTVQPAVIERTDTPPEPAPSLAATGPPGPTSVTAVFVDAGGLAVPGVELRFEGITGRPDALEPTSTFSTGGGAARLRLQVERGRWFARFAWGVEGYCMGGRETELDVGGTTDLGTIVLAPGTPVSGRVVDPAGRPVAGARVWAGDAEIPAGDPGQIARKGPATVSGSIFERDATPSVTSDADGRFRIPGVPEGTARVWAHAEDACYSTSEPFEVPPGREVLGVEVVLAPLAREDLIEGVVLARDGTPIPHANVTYSLHDEGFGISSSAEVDAEGHFRLVVWRRVAHSFTARERDGNGVAHAARVEPGTLDLVLRMGEEDSYELVVTDPDGEAVETYQVTTCIGDEHSWSGHGEPGEEHPEGRMRIGKPQEAFWIDVRAPGYELGKLGPFEPERMPELLELVLAPAPVLSGRVLLDGEPEAGARVVLYQGIEGTRRLVVNGFPAFWQHTGEETRTDAKGVYRLTPRGAGEYVVRAEVTGHAPGESDPVRLASGAGIDDLDVRISEGGTLVVQVVVPQGDDPAGVVVAVTRGDGHPRTRRTDSEGLARFEHLLPGRWNVLEADQELDPSTTSSSSFDAPDGEPEPERPWVVEVVEGRTVRYALVRGGD